MCEKGLKSYYISLGLVRSYKLHQEFEQGKFNIMNY